MAQMLKHLSTMRETRVRALGWEDPLEKEISIHSSSISWKIPWTEKPGRLQSMGSQRVGHDRDFTFSSKYIELILKLPPVTIHYQLLELAQIHVHRIGDAIQQFSSRIQSFPVSGFFPMSHFFAPGGQNWSFSFS